MILCKDHLTSKFNVKKMIIVMILCLTICISYVAYDRAFKTTHLYSIAGISSSKIENESTNSTKNAGLLKDHYPEGFSNPRPELCPMLGENLKVMAVVISAPSHFDKRLVIRQSWGSIAARDDIKLGFLIGQTNDTEYGTLLEKEESIFSDIIRANFHDSYFNLTFKIVSMMQWVLNYCPNSRFVLKVDDDVFVNVNNLISLADKYMDFKNAVFGNIVLNWKPNRNKYSKFFVSKDEYNSTVYPGFAMGPAYLLPTSLVGKLYMASLNTNFLKFEDVFMTGIVAEKLNMTRIHVWQFGNASTSTDRCNAKKFITISGLKVKEQMKLFTYLNETKVNCSLHLDE